MCGGGGGGGGGGEGGCTCMHVRESDSEGKEGRCE